MPESQSGGNRGLYLALGLGAGVVLAGCCGVGGVVGYAFLVRKDAPMNPPPVAAGNPLPAREDGERRQPPPAVTEPPPVPTKPPPVVVPPPPLPAAPPANEDPKARLRREFDVQVRAELKAILPGENWRVVNVYLTEEEPLRFNFDFDFGNTGRKTRETIKIVIDGPTKDLSAMAYNERTWARGVPPTDSVRAWVHRGEWTGTEFINVTRLSLVEPNTPKEKVERQGTFAEEVRYLDFLRALGAIASKYANKKVEIYGE